MVSYPYELSLWNEYILNGKMTINGIDTRIHQRPEYRYRSQVINRSNTDIPDEKRH